MPNQILKNQQHIQQNTDQPAQPSVTALPFINEDKWIAVLSSLVTWNIQNSIYFEMTMLRDHILPEEINKQKAEYQE